MNNDPSIILQARMGSSRLPGKMTRPFAQGKTLFEFVLERLQRSGLPLLVAISKSEEDDELARIVEERGLNLFRGSEENVLERFIEAARAYDVKNIIRVCGDNPFIQPTSLKRLAEGLQTQHEADYIAYRTSQGIPTIRTHWGFWGEGVTRKALEEAHKIAEGSFYREHVTNFIYFHPERFRCEWINIPRTIDAASRVRLTVDTEEDLKLCREIAETYPDLLDDPEQLVETIQEHPEWLERMNQAIKEQAK